MAEIQRKDFTDPASAKPLYWRRGLPALPELRFVGARTLYGPGNFAALSGKGSIDLRKIEDSLVPG
jgi:hypothetical protein